MKIGPKYKIARRLGAPVFEKTQTQKFVLSESKRKPAGRGRPKSNFGSQMLEKQKARYNYLLSEKQFSRYVKEATARKDSKPTAALYELLETRLDNVALRLGFAPTRSAARQLVSHGHVTVNGRKVTIPSIQVRVGDKVAIRKESAGKPLFATLDERQKTMRMPLWVKYDYDKKEGTIQGLPKLEGAELLFDINAVFEFYSR